MQGPRKFDKEFKQRYQSEIYNYEGIDIETNTPEGSGDYVEYTDKETKIKEVNNNEFLNLNIEPIRYIFYLAIAIAIIVLVYVLFKDGSTGWFSKKQNRVINHHQDINSDNIENTDINALIKQAEDLEDYRLAIRYFYLLVLKNLSIKNHIKFEDDKTNSEYLNEISSKPLSDHFAYTSYLYNYIWYGKFSVNLEQYQKAKSNFTTLLNLVK
ncbi:hypothetical protein [Aestuariibaculum sediminum]|uniref:DUF4129 domain-containing protein n=1 Tax=Aestuariibaculum sediminum TaxID=2770637 RepID=A0A8J6Q8X4_9FLAO|nr:hypothetical protein [Aestuariibaculum sediminum]MBD0833120.1 hypothetical protein [Aestuariibaculum sediminum]